jgi:hypothetical protein
MSQKLNIYVRADDDTHYFMITTTSESYTQVKPQVGDVVLAHDFDEQVNLDFQVETIAHNGRYDPGATQWGGLDLVCSPMNKVTEDWCETQLKQFGEFDDDKD